VLFILLEDPLLLELEHRSTKRLIGQTDFHHHQLIGPKDDQMRQIILRIHYSVPGIFTAEQNIQTDVLQWRWTNDDDKATAEQS
jgi:hypothetical protein